MLSQNEHSFAHFEQLIFLFVPSQNGYEILFLILNILFLILNKWAFLEWKRAFLQKQKRTTNYASYETEVVLGTKTEE